MSLIEGRDSFAAKIAEVREFLTALIGEKGITTDREALSAAIGEVENLPATDAGLRRAKRLARLWLAKFTGDWLEVEAASSDSASESQACMKTAEAIRAIRQHAELDVDEAADVLNVSPRLLDDVENGRTAVPVSLIESVGAAFGIDPQVLATRESTAIKELNPKTKEAARTLLVTWKLDATLAHQESVA